MTPPPPQITVYDVKQMCYNCSINPQSFDTEGPWMCQHTQPELSEKQDPWRHADNRNATKGKQWGWKTVFFFLLRQEAKLKYHDTRGLRKCNLSASEGHCRHIYSLCHEETYFSSACGITSYKRLSPVESFPQQCNKNVSLYVPIPSMIGVSFNV